MKKATINLGLLSLIVSGLTFISGCAKLTEHSIKEDMQGKSFTILITPSTGTFEFSGTVPVNIDSLCKAHSLPTKDITKIRLTSCTMKIEDTATVNPATFNLFRTFEGKTVTSGKPDILVIADYDIPYTKETEIGVNIVDVNIQDIISSNKFDLKLSGILKNVPIDHSFNLIISIRYHLEATTTDPKAG